MGGRKQTAAEVAATAEALPLTAARLERALVDVLGGSEAGWSFWLAGLAKIEQAVRDSREGRDRFCSWPPQELRRLVTDLGDALELAMAAVEVQLVANGEPDEQGAGRRGMVDALLARARQLAEDRARL